MVRAPQLKKSLKPPSAPSSPAAELFDHIKVKVAAINKRAQVEKCQDSFWAPSEAVKDLFGQELEVQDKCWVHFQWEHAFPLTQLCKTHPPQHVRMKQDSLRAKYIWLTKTLHLQWRREVELAGGGWLATEAQTQATCSKRPQRKRKVPWRYQ
eukprot:NODE_2350_length_715_cov_61.644144_g1904_i0.p1 GENE.NODE_2350_length_715_cov_61.644144_g1904_i0~~NODE_2350_length_715_cov_61.644144_g1904_i0.p1  ORF type:complete len:153 (-),score=17.90 NODE_2350_length_715_cov_61.644144_g1904_i0:198-656(-)